HVEAEERADEDPVPGAEPRAPHDPRMSLADPLPVRLSDPERGRAAGRPARSVDPRDLHGPDAEVVAERWMTRLGFAQLRLLDDREPGEVGQRRQTVGRD